METKVINVLLTEDDQVDIKIIRRALSGRNNPQFRITAVSSLQEGLAAAENSVVDVVLLDLNLPDYNGLETVDRFKAACPQLPVVVLTGLNDQEFGLQALLAGAQDYLVKGQIGDELLVRVLLYAIERNRIKNRLIEDELKIRLFVKHSPVALAVFDRKLRYVAASQRWLDDYGFKEEKIIGELHYDVMAGISEQWKKRHQQSLAGKIIKMDEDLLTFPDGRQEWIRWEMHPWRDPSGQIGGIIIFRENITDRKNAELELIRYKEELEKRVEERTAQLRNLNVHLENAREQERKMIAREVHDELGQALTAVKMDVAWVKRHTDPAQADVNGRLDEMSKLITDTIQTVQRICSQLRPGILDDLGLVAALEWLTEDFQKRAEIPCDIAVNFDDDGLDPLCATTIFRVYQEALTNILRHAEASRVHAQLESNGEEIFLQIRDNGKGIDPRVLDNASSYGLVGMRERITAAHGDLSITGKPDGGTIVRVTLPWNNKERGHVEDLDRR